MGLLDIFRREKKKPAVELLQQISKRAEDLTPEEQANSFVAIRRINGALQSRDSRIIFGRRGTGKTHILAYIASIASNKREFYCSVDLRTLGSNNSIYSDQSIPASARATTLIRDLLTVVHERIMEIYTDPKSGIKDHRIGEYLDRLQACVKTVMVTETQEARGKISQSDASKLKAGARP